MWHLRSKRIKTTNSEVCGEISWSVSTILSFISFCKIYESNYWLRGTVLKKRALRYCMKKFRSWPHLNIPFLQPHFIDLVNRLRDPISMETVYSKPPYLIYTICNAKITMKKLQLESFHTVKTRNLTRASCGMPSQPRYKHRCPHAASLVKLSIIHKGHFYINQYASQLLLGDDC